MTEIEAAEKLKAYIKCQKEAIKEFTKIAIAKMR